MNLALTPQPVTAVELNMRAGLSCWRKWTKSGVSTLVEEEFRQLSIVFILKVRGVLPEEEDVLVNLNLVDKQEAEKNIELWKKQSVCLPHAQKRAWTWHSKNLPLSWPSSVSSWRGCGYSPIWTRACIINKFWELARRGPGLGLWLASKVFHT